MAEPALVGLALAGGRSSRFGGEKSAARLYGTMLLELAVRRLEEACAAVAVSAPPGSEAEQIALGLGAPVLPDPPGAPKGPLVGVCAGLRWAREQGAGRLAVLPCDLPLLPQGLVARLAGALGAADGAAAARSPDGLQPLCVVLRVETYEGLAAQLEQGEHPPVQAWLRRVGLREVAFDDAGAFVNVNTRADLARLGGGA